MNPHLENFNYYNDRRNRIRQREPILFTTDEEGNDIERELPTHWIVCPLCEGAGKVVNPSIDAGGLTYEDFDDDPEFEQAYFAGEFDITCPCCNGRTTIQTVDIEALDEETRKAYLKQLQDEAEFEAQQLAELRMGA